MLIKLISVVLTLGLVSAGLQAEGVLRLDASSDASAESSWKEMLDTASPDKRQKLVAAMLEINLAGVKSATQVFEMPDRDQIGIARIKDKVAGMTADQIIDLGKKVSTVRVEFGSGGSH